MKTVNYEVHLFIALVRLSSSSLALAVIVDFSTCNFKVIKLSRHSLYKFRKLSLFVPTCRKYIETFSAMSVHN